MADNVVADPGVGGATFAADDITGVHYPRTKLVHGADGVNDGDVSTANPFPVQIRATSAALVGGDATNGLDVDVTRVLPGSGATALGKDEDAVHTSGDTGVFVLGVRQDSGTPHAADGDYIPFSINGSGALRVVQVGGLAAGTNNIGDVDVLTVPAPLSTTGGGTEATALRGGWLPYRRGELRRKGLEWSRDDELDLRRELERAYAEIIGEAREAESPPVAVKELQAAVAPHVKTGSDMALPPAAAIDFAALARDLRAAEALLEIYERMLDDDETTLLMLLSGP